jgi:ribosomal protein L12E/L44/L45/RPP1/RPP2
MVHEVFRTEELSERRCAHSVDHAGIEVEEIRARYVHAARGPVVKQVDEVDLRVVVAAVLAVAPEAVFVAQKLLNRGAHMVTAPARQYMNNLAHRTGPPACK